MNELIEKLAEQAEQYVKSNPQAGVTIHGGDMFNKKFTELIVLECINAVMDGTKEGDHYAMRIEQHFDNTQGGILHYGDEE